MPAGYLKRASQADAWARRATTPAERKAFEEIAALWRRLAEQKARERSG